MLHISSLPSQYGIGDFGPAAYQFVDFLAAAGQGYWQVLPLNPTTPARQHSPYEALSSFAGNPLFISPYLLVEQGLLDERELHKLSKSHERKIAYDNVVQEREVLLNLAYSNFVAAGDNVDFNRFCEAQGDWLEEYSLFMALRRLSPGHSWWDWPRALRDRHQADIAEIKEKTKDTLAREKFFQYLFFQQWLELKRYANRKGVRIIGDLSFYVGQDSADVWASHDIFMLTESKKPRFVSGVPPDCFSDTGQLWGNPVYDWHSLEKKGYGWWIRRIGHNLELFDLLRIDHFRGFAASWHIPADAKTAVNGAWVEGPKDKFFAALFKQYPFAPLIAEDLGTITADVRDILQQF